MTEQNIAIENPEMRYPNLRLGVVLGLACGLGAVLVVPYLATMLPELKDAPLPIWGVALVSGLQTAVLCTVLATIGLKAGRELGLGAPWLEALIRKQPLPPAKVSTFAGAGLLGVILAASVAVADTFWLLPLVTPIAEVPESPGPLLGLMASFYGGVAEEVMVRLFLVTGLVWLLMRVRVPRTAAIFAAIGFAALMFGVLHLPAAAGIFVMSGWLVFRIILLNAVLGLGFGLLYYRYGLEHAMASHIAADLVLHVVLVSL